MWLLRSDLLRILQQQRANGCYRKYVEGNHSFLAIIIPTTSGATYILISAHILLTQIPSRSLPHVSYTSNLRDVPNRMHRV